MDIWILYTITFNVQVYSSCKQEQRNMLLTRGPKLLHFLLLMCILFSANAQVTKEFVLAANSINAKIYNISLETEAITSLNIFGLQAPTGVLYYHHDPDNVYIVNSPNKTIMWCSSSEANCTSFSTGDGFPQRISVDYSTGHLYYTAEMNPSLDTDNFGYISVFDPNKRIHRKLVNGLGKPRAIVLYPSKGFMFWTDHFGLNHHIGRAGMDGQSSKKVIARRDVMWPKGLVIDYKADRIYWADSYFDRIESSNLDGDDFIIVYQDLGANMADIALYGDYLYYVGWNKQGITKVNKNNSTDKSLIGNVTELQHIDSIIIVPGNSQPQNQECSKNNGKCSDFCLPTHSSRICGCDENSLLNLDGQNCTTQTRCDTSFKRGRFLAKCQATVGSMCDYNCNNGYTKNRKIKNITCQENGEWNKNLESLCQDTKSQKSYDMSIIEAGVVGGIVGTLVSISVVILVVAVLYRHVLKKRLNKFNANLQNVHPPYLSSKGYLTATDLNGSIYNEIDGDGTCSTVLSTESIGCPSCSPSPQPEDLTPSFTPSLKMRTSSSSSI